MPSVSNRNKSFPIKRTKKKKILSEYSNKEQVTKKIHNEQTTHNPILWKLENLRNSKALDGPFT